MTVAQDFEEFFASCNKNGVEYLVVGGYAFALHARPRYTGDLDVFVRSSEGNARLIIKALADSGFELSSLTWEDLTVSGRVIQLGYPPLRIDIMTAIDGVSFEDAWSRRVQSRYGNQMVHFISREDLIATSGRRDENRTCSISRTSRSVTFRCTARNDTGSIPAFFSFPTLP